MKRFKFICCFIICTWQLCFSQLCYNKGQLLSIQDSALVYVMGSYENDSSASLHNNGKLFLDSSFINTTGSTAQKSGKYFLKGNWINNSFFIPDSSKVYLWAAHQFIKGTSVTSFYDLLCSGTGPKELNVNAVVLDSLVFANLEIKTNNDTLFFDNTDPSALSHDTTFNHEGYISNSSLGALSRKVSLSNWYEYPLGTNLSGSVFYRPIELKNSNQNISSTDRVAISFNKFTATIQGFNIDSTQIPLCKVDSSFFHEVYADAHNSYDIRYYYYVATDHNWNTIADWQNINKWAEINNSIPQNGNAGYYMYIQKDSFLIDRYWPIALADQYPTISSILGNDTACLKSSINLSVLVNPSANYEFNWTSNGIHQFTSNDSTHLHAGILYTTPGSYQVHFNLMDTMYGCANLTKTINVQVNPLPHAGFTILTNPIYNGIPVQFQDQSSGAISWYYDLGNGHNSVSQNPSAVYLQDGNIIIEQIVMNQYGCRDTLQKTITIGDGIVIPNIFTPNGDGLNDLFFIKGAGIKNYSIEIMNRWGELLFKGDNNSAAWDGKTISGQECPDGTYYYILVVGFNNGEKKYNGFLELLR